MRVARISSRALASVLLLTGLTAAADTPAAPEPQTDEGRSPWSATSPILVYRGMSDASAAVAMDERTFVVADDESNVLRLYTAGEEQPTARLDLTGFLAIDPRFPEADIEGAARIGRRIYWVASHGRNRDGKWRPNRHRFFATEIVAGAGGLTLRSVGRPYTKLAERLVSDDTVRRRCPDLPKSLRPNDKKSKRLAPKKSGLNIESLCAAPDGKTLYLGLRNPLVADGKRRRAIVVPLMNAGAVVEGGRDPIFGEPLLWDLAGYGMRAMEYSSRHKAYYIVAGPHEGKPGWAMYRWSGAADEPPTLLGRVDPDKARIRPEALIVFADSDKLLLLSDDGTVPIPVSGPAECKAGRFRPDRTCLNKHLRNDAKKRFGGVWVTVP